jgi:P27 family predicted phage terminase small subunit
MGKGRFALKPAQRPGRPPNPIEDNNWKMAPTAMPDMPGLPSVAAEEAGRLTRYLVALDRVAAIDRQALAAYCSQWAIFERIMRTEFSRENCYLASSGTTCEVAHPLIAPLLRSAKATMRLAGLFGMTARTRDLESDNGNRKASALKRLMGNQRKVAEGRLAPSILPMLPDFGAGDLTPPLWMNHRAREEFERLGRELELLDLFTPLDLVPLVIVSSLFDLYLRANEQLRDLTTVVTSRDGEETGYKEHPLLKSMTEIGDVMHAIWKDYGQTPRYRKVFNGERRTEEKEIPLVFKGAFG